MTCNPKAYQVPSYIVEFHIIHPTPRQCELLCFHFLYFLVFCFELFFLIFMFLFVIIWTVLALSTIFLLVWSKILFFLKTRISRFNILIQLVVSLIAQNCLIVVHTWDFVNVCCILPYHLQIMRSMIFSFITKFWEHNYFIWDCSE